MSLPVRLAGVDVSYEKSTNTNYGGVVILERRGPQKWETVEEQWSVGKAAFPYVPGLLSFREMPVLLDAFSRVQSKPDGVLVDGQGLAHPRRLGLACHLGLFIQIPTIGCAKSRLIGTHTQPGEKRGGTTTLMDARERIGTVARTKDGCNPLYVSRGYGLSLADSLRWVMLAHGGYRLPEPTRRAHLLVNRVRREHA